MTTFDAGASLAADLALAIELADAADAISLPRFGASDLRVASKPDMTPVSDADLAVETALRGILAQRRPDDAVIGEEFGTGARTDTATGSGIGIGNESATAESATERAGRGRAWIIDPIDGTKNFVRDVPVWATLIALMIDGAPVLGVVSAPALGRRWWGAADSAWTSFQGGVAKPCHVSHIDSVHDASLSIAQLNSWEAVGRGAQMHELSARCWRTRGYGDFFSYVLVAQGAVDIAAEPELSLWDLAALAPIVIAAGGAFSTVDGHAIDARATSAIATNGLLHAEVVAGLTRE
ncbi:MAG: inositol monophosphatase family protein [Nakamurella sp.]